MKITKSKKTRKRERKREREGGRERGGEGEREKNMTAVYFYVKDIITSIN